jgi:hypothetical protein
LVEVDRVGDDVGGLRDADLALTVRFQDLGAMVLDNLGELLWLATARRLFA